MKSSVHIWSNMSVSFYTCIFGVTCIIFACSIVKCRIEHNTQDCKICYCTCVIKLWPCTSQRSHTWYHFFGNKCVVVCVMIHLSPCMDKICCVDREIDRLCKTKRKRALRNAAPLTTSIKLVTANHSL